jgi:hypothetical protein
MKHSNLLPLFVVTCVAAEAINIGEHAPHVELRNYSAQVPALLADGLPRTTANAMTDGPFNLKVFSVRCG